MEAGKLSARTPLRDSGVARRDPLLGLGQGALALYTAEEAAVILRVKKSWLERQAAARKIPFSMLGGSYRFSSVHLAAIVQMYEQAPAAPTRTGRDSGRRRLSSEPPGTGERSAPLRPRPRSGPRRAA